jgi:hypothetical protein
VSTATFVAIEFGPLDSPHQPRGGLPVSGVQVDSSVALQVRPPYRVPDLLFLLALLVVDGQLWSGSDGPATAQTAQPRSESR